MKLYFKILASVLSVALVVALVGCGDKKADNMSESKSEIAEPKASSQSDMQKAADFTLTDIDGKAVSLSDFNGKVKIIDFWATWCPPCVKEIPHFNDLYAEYKDQGLEVIGVSVDQGGWKAVRSFLDRTPITYTLLQEDTGYDFYPHHFAEPNKIVQRLQNGNSILDKHLWSLIDHKSQSELKTTNLEALKNSLADAFNKLVKGPNLYTAERFATVQLDVDPQRLEGFNPDGERLYSFNSFLLRKAFNSELSSKMSETYQNYLPVDERGGIPYTFIVDRKGNVVEHFVGYRDKEVFEEVIKKLL